MNRLPNCVVMCGIGAKGISNEDVEAIQEVMVQIEVEKNRNGPNLAWPNVAPDANGKSPPVWKEIRIAKDPKRREVATEASTVMKEGIANVDDVRGSALEKKKAAPTGKRAMRLDWERNLQCGAISGGTPKR